ncbi:hypothetical protein BH23GEM8_BH23GEM8_20710 [soil metagenome]
MLETLVSPGFFGSLFLFAAVAGIAVLILATISAFVGGHDQLGDAHLHDGLDLLSIRSLATAFAAFGLTGYFSHEAGLWGPLAMGIAAPVGLAAGAAVAYLLRWMTRLEADGTPRLQDAIGEAATVYIAIPEGGTGRITLSLQGQTVECDAVSMDGPLGPGHRVIVTDVLDGEILEVQIYPSLKELTA